MEIVNSYEAKTHLSELIRRSLAGERIVIAKAGRPLVELTPFQPSPPRVGGLWKGKVWIAEDFDSPIPELERDFYGDDIPA